MRITATCRVSVSALDGILGPAVIGALGNPRLSISVQEQIGGNRSSLSAAESEITRVFGRAGFLLQSGRAGANVLILGNANTRHVRRGALEGVPIFRVNAEVTLEAVIADTGHQIARRTANTSMDSAQPTGAGASKTLTDAASSVSVAMVNEIAYGLWRSQGGGLGLPIVITINNITFREVEAVTEALQRLAGRGGDVFVRSYENQMLEIDFVSNQSVRIVTSFLSDQGVEIEGFTSHTISGRMVR